MSGDKPKYNPEDEYNYDKEMTPEEKKKVDEEKEARTARAFAFGRARKEAEAKPLKKLREEFRSGLGMHHKGRVLPADKLDRRDKSEIQEDREAAMERLKNKIRDLLKNYKLHKIFNFKITVSDKDRDKYSFKLLENYKTVEEYEDRLENISSRLEEILKNKYADRLP